MLDPRVHWLPEFERIGIHAAFEHHVHAMKATVPMSIDSKPAKESDVIGTTYFGDGRWGITGGDDMLALEAPTDESGQPMYQGVVENHVWLAEISESNQKRQMVVRAIGADGEIDNKKWRRTIPCE